MTPNSSLLQWLATFEIDGEAAVELKDDAYYNLADGYVSARILNQISPQYFSDDWLDGIKPVPPNGSWRLRVSNLKRILQKIHDYASDLQSSQFRTNAITPDVGVIAQNFDPDQISRLIQLILFCAINCDKKQDYIEKIRDLPTQVKQDIKEAIEELLVKDNESSDQKFNSSQAFHDLELKLQQLQLEKEQLASENERLAHENERLTSEKSSPMSLDRRRRSRTGRDTDATNVDGRDAENRLNNIGDETSQNLILQQNKRLQSELHGLKEELINIETEKEEYRLKSYLLKEDIERITSKHEELRHKAEQVKRLQDELDEHRHISEKIVSYETTIENLVKRNNEMKQELKIIEEKSVSQTHKIVRLEEENNHLNQTISRSEIYKKQLQEAQVKLSQETHRADQAEMGLIRLTEKYSATKKENEKLFETTNQLIRSNSNAAVKGAQSPGLPSTNDNFDQEQGLDLEAALKESSSDNTLALMNRVEELQRLLFQKEQELMDSEMKYKRNLQKAKEVIKTLNNNQSMNSSLHPSCMSSASFNSSTIDETNMLKQQLVEREERLIEMEREFYEFKKLKEMHERLIISAFYGLTTPMQWKNAERRLERTTLTSPPNTASSSINHSKHSH